MSYTVLFAPEAQHHLADIELYIAGRSGSSETAARFVNSIITHCESMELFPERGTRRDDLLPGLRITGYRKSVTLAFRVDTQKSTVTILGVFYHGQDYSALIAPPDPGESGTLDWI